VINVSFWELVVIIVVLITVGVLIRRVTGKR
jgi:hypothetical protein